jgi:hypothetical protein
LRTKRRIHSPPSAYIRDNRRHSEARYTGVTDQRAIEKLLRSEVAIAGSYRLASRITPADAYRIELSADRFVSAAEITSRIDALIADEDMYEPNEPRPTKEAIDEAKDLIVSAERYGSKYLRPEISVYYGEIDITWRVSNRLLRLIVFSGTVRPAVLYYQTDKGEALTRGESLEVQRAEDLSRKLIWLLG